MTAPKPGARRGADVLVSALKRAGVTKIFALSGNHIMSLFDALYDSDIELVHTRHEAACIHMADAYARLTGDVGVALVTGGQGFTNAAAGLPTALAADSPVLLLSGDTPISERGRGAFQELDQVAMSRPVTKASLQAETADDLGNGILRAISLTLSGRPGPVHMALPTDLLEAASSATLSATATPIALDERPSSLQDITKQIAAAARPLLLGGPLFAHGTMRVVLRVFERATGIPAMVMESPRGLNEPGLGAFAEVVAAADLIILAGKPLDFTLRFGASPAVADATSFIVIDPDAALIKRAKHERSPQIAATLVADPHIAVGRLSELLSQAGDPAWLKRAKTARDFRPAHWPTTNGTHGRLHPLELCRAVQQVLDADTRGIFISDGGEIGQWAQAAITARRRVINGVAGSIGASVPFALAARTVEREAPIIAVMGDGTFGFHMAEFDTAVRHNLPFVAVVGNDSAWNAEHQIQLRQYGQERAHGCTLLPTRYDQVATALGGHGEWVTATAEMGPALARAIASGKPACVNVMIEGFAAPVIKRT